MKARGAPIFSKPLIAFSFFVLALLLRTIFAIQWQDMPYGTSPLLDADIYDKTAWAIANGKGAGSGAFYQSPLYPYVLSLFYRLIGHSYLAASFLNAIIDASTVALLCLISYSLFGRAASISAGVLTSFLAPMIFYTAPPMKEPLTLFLFALFLFFALRTIKANQWKDYLLAGVSLGLAVLSRGNALILTPLIPIMAFMRYRRPALKGVICYVLAIFLMLVPIAWYNYAASQDFVLMTYDGGFNLYIGHSPYANGTNAYPPELSTSPEQEKLDVVLTAERERGYKLKPSEVSAYWRDKAYDFAIHHPWREVQLLGLKLFAFWNDANDVDNYDIRFIKENFSSILNLPLVNFWLISALSAFVVFGGGAQLKEGKNRWSITLLVACILLYMLSLLIFYVTDRYRLPVVIFLIPLASAAPQYAWTWIKKRAHMKLACGVSGAIVFSLIALHAPFYPVDLRAFDWGVLTAVYANKGENERALNAFHNGIAISPPHIGVQAYISVASVYERVGQMDMATKIVERAVEIYPQNGVALYNLGRLQALEGKLDQALESLQKAQKLMPDYVLTYFALTKIYQKKGLMDQAKESLQNGLFVDPEDPYLLSLKPEIGIP